MVEGNNYFSREMSKYRSDLIESGADWQERMVLSLNYYVSDFGRSYMRPATLILVFSAIYWLVIYAYENNYLYRISPEISFFSSKLSWFVNGIARNITPFKYLLKEGMESVSLLFGLVFSTLIWQFIVSVKRCTKR